MVGVGAHPHVAMLNQSGMLAKDPDYKKLATFPVTMPKRAAKNGRGKEQCDVKQGEVGEIYLRGPLLSDFTYNNDDAKRREIAPRRAGDGG
jgi:hypothetical protein